jgi:type IV secretory pathway VirD2 relaxase
VKARIVRHSGARFRAAPLARHIAYLGREGVTRDGSEAGLFNATSDSLDHDAFAERCEEDRHHFRFIVSPEDAGDMSDLRAFSRELMEDVARDLETSSTGWRSITGTPTIPISIFWCGAGPMTAAIW